MSRFPKGVSKKQHPIDRPYQAKACFQNKVFFLGHHQTEEEAAAAVRKFTALAVIELSRIASLMRSPTTERYRPPRNHPWRIA
jgi:hypothetical protein